MGPSMIVDGEPRVTSDRDFGHNREGKIRSVELVALRR
jgi:hypothetical protein